MKLSLIVSLLFSSLALAGCLAKPGTQSLVMATGFFRPDPAEVVAEEENWGYQTDYSVIIPEAEKAEAQYRIIIPDKPKIIFEEEWGPVLFPTRPGDDFQLILEVPIYEKKVDYLNLTSLPPERGFLLVAKGAFFARVGLLSVQHKFN